jgi:hypothetical protein
VSRCPHLVCGMSAAVSSFFGSLSLADEAANVECMELPLASGIEEEGKKGHWP